MEGYTGCSRIYPPGCSLARSAMVTGPGNGFAGDAGRLTIQLYQAQDEIGSQFQSGVAGPDSGKPVACHARLDLA